MNWREYIKNNIKSFKSILIKEQPSYIRIDDAEQSNSYLTCSLHSDNVTLERAHFSRISKNEYEVVSSGYIEAVFDPDKSDAVRFIENESEFKNVNLKYTIENAKELEKFMSIPLYKGWTETEFLVDNEVFKVQVDYLNHENKLKSLKILLLQHDIPLLTDYIAFPFIYLYLHLRYYFNKRQRIITVKPLKSEIF